MLCYILKFSSALDLFSLLLLIVGSSFRDNSAATCCNHPLCSLEIVTYSPVNESCKNRYILYIRFLELHLCFSWRLRCTKDDMSLQEGQIPKFKDHSSRLSRFRIRARFNFQVCWTRFSYSWPVRWWLRCSVAESLKNTQNISKRFFEKNLVYSFSQKQVFIMKIKPLFRMKIAFFMYKIFFENSNLNVWTILSFEFRYCLSENHANDLCLMNLCSLAHLLWESQSDCTLFWLEAFQPWSG